MHVDTVTTADGSLLTAVRENFLRRTEALMCVAFISESGVQLVAKELEGVVGSKRVLTTTVFGSTTASALAALTKIGAEVRVHNPPGRSTYHPKIYIGRGRAKSMGVVLGSANMTAGLVCNREAAAWMRGTADEAPIAKAWEFSESLWDHPLSQSWEPGVAKPDASRFGDDLYRRIVAAIEENAGTFTTLGASPQPNTVTEYTYDTLYVRTRASDARREPAQPIPAWMFELAWDYLRTHGHLTNKYLLTELRVHRSSAVCAVLATLPGVHRVPGRAVALRYDAAGDVGDLG